LINCHSPAAGVKLSETPLVSPTLSSQVVAEDYAGEVRSLAGSTSLLSSDQP
jgi:hypothetical protein